MNSLVPTDIAVSMRQPHQCFFLSTSNSGILQVTKLFVSYTSSEKVLINITSVDNTLHAFIHVVILMLSNASPNQSNLQSLVGRMSAPDTKEALKPSVSLSYLISSFERCAQQVSVETCYLHARCPCLGPTQFTIHACSSVEGKRQYVT